MIRERGNRSLQSESLGAALPSERLSVRRSGVCKVAGVPVRYGAKVEALGKRSITSLLVLRAFATIYLVSGPVLLEEQRIELLKPRPVPVSLERLGQLPRENIAGCMVDAQGQLLRGDQDGSLAAIRMRLATAAAP